MLAKIVSEIPGCSIVAGLGKDFVAFLRELKSPQGKLSRKVNRLKIKYGNDWDELGKAILIEMGGELNGLSKTLGSTKAAVNTISKTHGLTAELVNNLFYAVGAPFQGSGAQFEMIKVKDSLASKLVDKLREMKMKDIEWDTAKQDLLSDVDKSKMNPEDKRTLRDGVESASNYTKAESSLLYMHLAHVGMRTSAITNTKQPRVKAPTREQLDNPPIIVAYSIPWKLRQWVRKAQLAANNHVGIKLAAKSRGLFLVADQDALRQTGLAVDCGPSLLMRTARRKYSLISARWTKNIDRTITAELHFNLPKLEAIKEGKLLVKNGLTTAKVWDRAGNAYLVRAQR